MAALNIFFVVVVFKVFIFHFRLSLLIRFPWYILNKIDLYEDQPFKNLYERKPFGAALCKKLRGPAERLDSFSFGCFLTNYDITRIE